MINEGDYTIVGTFGAELPGHRPVLPAGRRCLTGCTGCAGSWRPRCSRPWQPSTARRCRRWPSSTRPRSTHRTGRAPASKPGVERNGRKPLVARFGGIPLKRQKIGGPHRPPTDPGRLSAQGADHPAPRGYVRALPANGQRASPPRPQARRPRHDPDRSSPNGPRQWPTGAARPSWSAPPATTISTPGNQPHRSRSSHWRAG